MLDLNYHKGQKCVYGSTFCQEGFCLACNIYLSRLDGTIFATNMRSSRTDNLKIDSRFARIESLQPV